MPYKDPEIHKAKQRERSKRYRDKKHAERFGIGAGNMSGKHGHHASGEKSGKWNGGKMLTSHGYVAVRVHVDHPHGWGSPRLKKYKYAYEHIVVMMKRLGRPLNDDEIVHHLNGVRSENADENLELQTVTEHANHHSSMPDARDTITGRFKPGKRH
jgi:hypothetical protein